MYEVLLAGVMLFLAADESVPSLLDNLDPKKIPAAVRPTKNLAKEVIAVLGDGEARVDGAVFRADGRLLAVAGTDGVIRIWDLSTFKVIGTARPKDVACLAFTPSGKSLVVGDSLGTLRSWTVGPPTTAGVNVPAHKDGPLWATAFSTEGNRLATGGSDKAIRLWDINKGISKPTRVVTGHTGRIRGLAFSKDGNLLASASEDGTARVWELASETPKQLHSFDVKGRVYSVALSGDGKSLLVGAAGVVKLYSLKEEKPEEVLTITLENRSALTVQFSPDEKSILALTTFDRNEDRIYIWDLESKTKYESAFKHRVKWATYAPDGRHLAVVNESSTYLLRLPN